MTEQKKFVAIFGSSEAKEGDADYENARATARALAEKGFGIITGGYGGIMEAANRGAKEGGGKSVGVTVQAFSSFKDRRVNSYLDEERSAPTLFKRTEELIESADAYVIFPGSAGTLAEVALLWALVRARLLKKPIVLMGKMWEHIIMELEKTKFLTSFERDASTIAGSPEEAVNILSERFSL